MYIALNQLCESHGFEICIIIIIIVVVIIIIILSFSFPFISKPEKRPTRGTRNRRRRGCSLVLFKKTSLKKRIRDGSRAAGGRARFFIQSSSTFYSSFSFSSFRPLTPPPPLSWILYQFTLTVVRVSFMTTKKSSGSFLCTSFHPLCLFFFLFQRDIHSSFS